jgi:hypothetical protein
LILRRATQADTQALVDFNASIHSDEGPDKPDEGIAAWTRDLMSGNHPTFRPGDFTIVEDSQTGKIVSTLCLISQTWTYGGIPFGVGRVELVATHPKYRRRGLVRAQFEIIHQLSAERGHMVQAITGIPWYYRQFGYEMALELPGGKVGYLPQIPQLKKGETESYRVRQARESDLASIQSVYTGGSQRSLVACMRDEEIWHYELQGRHKKSIERRELRLIETIDGDPVGFLVHAPELHKSTLTVSAYELKDGISWLMVTPAVLRYLGETGKAYAKRQKKEHFAAFRFRLVEGHPLYRVIADRLPHKRAPYAWYLRVANLRGFLQHIAPVLERRLVESPLVKHTGELKLNFYRHGLTLNFKAGKLIAVDTWRPKSFEEGDVLFPDRTFLQVLFGFRSLKELEAAFPDCYHQNDQGRALIEVLCPKRPSAVWPLG